VADALAILACVSVILGAIAAALPLWNDAPRLQIFSQSATVFFTLVVFCACWFYSVFFWFRAAINMIKMFRHCKSSRFANYGEGFWNPLYGWRTKDLDMVGLRHRLLAIEGIVGFIVIVAFIWGAITLSRLVGIAW
jgi:hypothetical protein